MEAEKSEQSEMANNPTVNDNSLVGAIGADLSKESEATASDSTVDQGPQANTPMPFDIKNLTADQLSQLKAMLTATPDRMVLPKSRPIVTLPLYQNKVIIAWKRAYPFNHRDEFTNVITEKDLIPVRFLGEPVDKWEDIDYRELINAEKVKCEVVKITPQESIRKENVVISKETGRPVQQEVKEVKYMMLLQLPEEYGKKQVEISADYVNA